MYTKRVTGKATDVYALLAGVNLDFCSHRSLKNDCNRVVDTSAVNLSWSSFEKPDMLLEEKRKHAIFKHN